jgi:hypothetical protein
MKRKWCSLILIKNILQEIPEFLNAVYSLESQRDVMMGIGTYHLNSVYEFDALCMSDNNYLLYCERHDREADIMEEK